MGMFDWVAYSTVCSKCGKVLNGFQSKDGPCELLTLHPSEVDYFYNWCDCGQKNAFKTKRIHLLQSVHRLSEAGNLLDDNGDIIEEDVL